jgi:hypothetical protein
VVALIQGKVWGWTSAVTLAVFGAGVALLVAFWFIEHRVRSPIVEFDLFRNGPYFGASAAGFSLVGCYWALMFLRPRYLQTDLGHSALEAGVLILPVTAPMIVISPLGGRLMGLFGVRRLMTLGMALGTAGLMAGAITLASAGAVFQGVLDDDRHAGYVDPDAFPSALSSATWVLVALCAIGTVLTWAFVRSSADTAVAPEHHARHHFHLPWVGPLGATSLSLPRHARR